VSRFVLKEVSLLFRWACHTEQWDERALLVAGTAAPTRIRDWLPSASSAAPFEVIRGVAASPV
jgi:hypothetical protein